MAERAMLSPNAQSLPYLDSVLGKLHPQEMENAGGFPKCVAGLSERVGATIPRLPLPE
jgi:hypothetical protein